jgi:hypothetical protein
MSRYINGLPATMPKYIVDNGPGIEMEDGLQTSSEVIKLFTYEKAANVAFVEPNFDPSSIKIPSKIFLMNADDGFISYLRQTFPASRVEKIDVREGLDTDFTVIDVK